eukprot:362379-Prorocentrum_minimum.AAC.1
MNKTNNPFAPFQSARDVGEVKSLVGEVISQAGEVSSQASCTLRESSIPPFRLSIVCAASTSSACMSPLRKSSKHVTTAGVHLADEGPT